MNPKRLGVVGVILGVVTILAGSTRAAEPAITRDEVLKLAAASAAQIDERFARTWARYAVAEAWLRTDPASAAALADQLESWTAKRDLLSVVMVAWGRRAPQAAADWGLAFKQRTPGTLAMRNTALHYAVIGMVQQAPQLADELIWKHLQEEGWGGHPREAPMAAARELAKVDPPAALRIAEKIQLESYRVDALRGVLREWARKDPKAAQAAFLARKETELRLVLPQDLAEGWAHKGPREAAEYARAIPDRHTRAMALALVARELARTDAKGAADLCSALASANVGKWHEQMSRLGMVVGEVGEAFGKQDSQAAVKWAAGMPGEPGGCRPNAFDGVATGWAARDASAALAWYLSPEIADSRGRGAAVNRGTGAALPALARELSRTDSRAALQLAGKTESLVLKSSIIAAVAAVVVQRDPAEAASIVALWQGASDYYTYRAGAAAMVAGAWARSDPQAAVAWAAKVQPERDRLAALRRRRSLGQPAPGRRLCLGSVAQRSPGTRLQPRGNRRGAALRFGAIEAGRVRFEVLRIAEDGKRAQTGAGHLMALIAASARFRVPSLLVLSRTICSAFWRSALGMPRALFDQRYDGGAGFIGDGRVGGQRDELRQRRRRG